VTLRSPLTPGVWTFCLPLGQRGVVLASTVLKATFSVLGHGAQLDALDGDGQALGDRGVGGRDDPVVLAQA
jgi:hypothetical protein